MSTSDCCAQSSNLVAAIGGLDARTDVARQTVRPLELHFMKMPRAHHYVPQLYLQGFTDPSEKKAVLWVYEKGCPVRRSTPAASGHQRDFYAISDKDGKKSFDVEKWLADFEGVVAPVVQRGDPTEILERKALFSIFVALSQQRVPAAREYTQQLYQQMLAALRSDSAATEQWKSFLGRAAEVNGNGPFDDQFYDWVRSATAEEIRITPAQVIALTVGSALKHAEFLFQCGWELFTSPNQMLVTSDNPVCTVQPGDRLVFGMGYKAPGAEILFPVKRELLLRISRTLDSHRISPLPTAFAREVNKMTMHCATRFLFAPQSSEKLKALFDQMGCKLDFASVRMRPDSTAL